MQNRYENSSSSKQRVRAPSPKPRDNINIQIVNITTSRNRKNMHSGLRSKRVCNMDESMNTEEGVRRGRSVFHRKLNSSQVGEKPINLSSVYNQPVVPNYQHIKNISAKRLQSQKEMETQSKTFFSEEDIGIEELHYQKVKYQQHCKKLIKL